ncbi:unnamed protein product [Somion occarium]|uniref:Uncharacterized protein n=1 Tax=Somion occarium TaxID=3059160 RepID=A0ABP1DZX2_9APHY
MSKMSLPRQGTHKKSEHTDSVPISTSSVDIDTYRRLLAGMAETCRSLQARIRILEGDLATRCEQNRRLLCSPLPSPSLSSPPHRDVTQDRPKNEHRRHSAPQLTLAPIPELFEEPEPPHPPDQERESRVEIWTYHDDRALLEKAWLWY